MRNALKTWVSVLLAGAMTLALAPPASARKGRHHTDLAEILSQMNEASKRLKTVSANLDYTKVTVLVNDKSTESGQLFFRKGKTHRDSHQHPKARTQDPSLQKEQRRNLPPQDQPDSGIRSGTKERSGAAIPASGFRYGYKRVEEKLRCEVSSAKKTWQTTLPCCWNSCPARETSARRFPRFRSG